MMQYWSPVQVLHILLTTFLTSFVRFSIVTKLSPLKLNNASKGAIMKYEYDDLSIVHERKSL